MLFRSLLMLPDTSDTEKMARIGRITVLRKARREAAQQLRDRLIPMLNNLDHGDVWDVSGISDLVEQIKALSAAIETM